MKIKIRTIVILLVLGMTTAAGLIYFGIYNVAATEQHTAPVYKLLEYAMRKSVLLRADSSRVPDLSNEQRLRSGTTHFRAHCVQCHGAPGVAPEPFSYGMMPAPANLVAAAREWEPAELFWVIRHGIKMSGMPAWEYRLSEQEIWDIVAFVERLPTLSPQEYEQWGKQVPAQASPAPARLSEADNVALGAGDAKAGERALQQYLCVTCHQIPGVAGANRHVGPPLNGIAGRRYIGGVVLNTPENMVRWLQNPKQFAPLSAMPDLGVTNKDARDIAAFLSTLEDLD
ncbi:c-type cytochrome [Noviherbaspirillum saxi]|uniref:Cytochrome C n=1 Tax=Noviherbaspirillum saxi TaxID=2320863 RepID=A0A3A3FPP9_9BURK|nr:c-type cytochrome [Noviherbaspirillum saxi]RJF95669.1 cytochrome C [Noviherbaspirillum saxi]